jgi:hypothetical protein
MFSEEPTSNNIQWYQVKSAPGHFDTYLNSQIGTYSNWNLVISAPNVWLSLFNYVWLTQIFASDIIVMNEIVNKKWYNKITKILIKLWFSNVQMKNKNYLKKKDIRRSTNIIFFYEQYFTEIT